MLHKCSMSVIAHLECQVVAKSVSLGQFQHSMDVFALLDAPLAKSRECFGDRSLALLLSEVRCRNSKNNDDNNNNDEYHLQCPSAGDDACTSVWFRLGGEARFWRTTPRTELTKMQYQSVDYQISLPQCAKSIHIWRSSPPTATEGDVEAANSLMRSIKTNSKLTTYDDQETLLEIVFADQKLIMPDSYVLEIVQYALNIHYKAEDSMQVISIQNIVFPIAVFSRIYICCKSKRDVCDIILYDSDGCKSGELNTIVFSYKMNTSSSVEPVDSKRSNLNGYESCQANITENTKMGCDAQIKRISFFRSADEFTILNGHSIEQSGSGSCDNDLKFIGSSQYESRGECLPVCDRHDDNEDGIVHIEVDDGNSMECDIKRDGGRMKHAGDAESVDEKDMGIEERRYRRKERIKLKIKEVLSKYCAHVDDRATFISLGFDSLKLSSLEYELQSVFSGSIRVPSRITLRHPSVEALSTFLSNQNEPIDSPAYQHEKLEILHSDLREMIKYRRKIPLSAVQERFIILSKFAKSTDERFVEEVHLKVLKKHIKHFAVAFNRLIARQLILRTVYDSTSQEVLSSSEAYFWIRIEQRCENHVYRIDPLDDVPLRLRILAEESNCRVSILQHHIMTDAYSFNILARELKALCRCRSLKRLNFHYAHFSLLEWHRRNNKNSILHRNVYWQQTFSNLQMEKIPNEKSGSPLQFYSGKVMEIMLMERTVKGIRNTADKCGVTLFTVLLALYHLLLYKKYAIRDYCSGITVSERSRSEFRPLIGCFLNAVPIRLHVESSESVLTFIQTTFDVMNQCTQKQLPFNDLVSMLGLQREDITPLFRVMLVMDDVDQSKKMNGEEEEDGDSEMMPLQNWPRERDSNFGNYDQLWYFIQMDDCLNVRVEYNSRRFYVETVQKILQQYIKLVEIVSGNEGAIISDLSLMTSTDRLEQYRMIDSNKADFPHKCSIIDLITCQGAISAYCNQIAYRGLSFSNVYIERTSRQMGMNFVQRFMQHYGGMIRSDCITIVLLNRSITLVLTVIALWKYGLAVAPLNTDWPEERLITVIRELQNVPVVTLAHLLKPGAVEECFYLDVADVAKCVNHIPRQLLRKRTVENDMAYMTFTSGSTGVPKGIVTEMYGLNNLASTYAQQLALSSASKVYQVVNPSFDIFFADIVEALTNGAMLRLAREKIPNWGDMDQITHAHIMPAYLSIADQNCWNVLEKMHIVNFGGDILQANVLNNAIISGINLRQQYGLTEHSIYFTCKQMKVGQTSSNVGKPFQNVVFKVRNLDGNVCGYRERGICCTSGVGICRGYYNNEQLNANHFLADCSLTEDEEILAYDRRYLWTGDEADISDERGELRFYGRNDSQIKIKGVRVDLAEIEHHICSKWFIQSCVVVLRTVSHQSALVAYIILRGNQETNPSELRTQMIDFLSPKLPRVMIPNYYMVLQSFPLNSNGKIDRTLLPPPQMQPIFNGSLRALDYSNSTEKHVIELFKRVLQRSEVDLNDSFFEIGGDSLKALLIVQELQRNLSIQLQPIDIFQLTTLNKIFEYLQLSTSVSKALLSTPHTEADAQTDESRVHALRQNGSEKALENEEMQRGFSPADLLQRMDEHVFNYCDLEVRSENQYSTPSSNLNGCQQKFWLDKDGIPLSCAQERLLFLCQMESQDESCYVLRLKLKICGKYSGKKLSMAVNFLIRKHDVLRTMLIKDQFGQSLQLVLSLTESHICIRHQNDVATVVDRLNFYDSPPIRIVVDKLLDGLSIDLTMHHIITDGRSFSILSTDLIHFYQHPVGRTQISGMTRNPAKSYAYCSYIQRRHAWNEATKINEMIGRLRIIDALRLPTDLPRTDGIESKCAVIKSVLSLPRTTIEKYCAQQRCTVFAYLLSCFALLMRAVSGQKRFRIETPVANRTPETQDIAGLFVNTGIIAADTNSEKVSDLLQSMQATVAAVIESQHIPFEHVVRQLNPHRDLSCSSIHPISFIFQSASPSKMPHIAGATTEVEEISPRHSNYDQSWFLNMYKTRVEVEVQFRVSLYRHSTIEDLLDKYSKVAERLIFWSEIAISDHISSISKLNTRVDIFETMDTGTSDMKVKCAVTRPTTNVDCAPRAAARDCFAVEKREDVRRSLEQSLIRIWAQFLPTTENLSASDNFFAVGGHSLMIARICYKIEEELGYKCSPRDIFGNQTIEKLAAHLKTLNGTNTTFSPIVGITQSKKEHLLLPACELQNPILGLYHRKSESDLLQAYQTGFCICFEDVDHLRLKIAVNRILMHHLALRTMFYAKNEKFYQLIFSGSEAYVAIRECEIPSLEILPDPFKQVPLLCWLFHENEQHNATVNTSLTSLPRAVARIGRRLGAESKERVCFEMVISHVICDGTSMRIIGEDMRNIYFKSENPTINRYTYVDFTKEYHRRLEVKRVEVERYWKKISRNAKLMEFVCDKIEAFQGKRYECATVRKTFKNLNLIVKRISAIYGCSGFAIMLASFARTLRHRIADNSLTISCPFDMRQHSENRCVGLCINTLPIILEVRENAVEEELQNAARVLAEAFQHSEISSTQLREIFANDLEPFKVMLVEDDERVASYIDQNDDSSNLAGDDCRRIQRDLRFTKSDVTLFVETEASNLKAKMEYKNSIFYKEHIEIMLDEWAKNMEMMVGNNLKNNEVYGSMEEIDFPKVSFPRLLDFTFTGSVRPFGSLKNSLIEIDYETLGRKVKCVARSMEQRLICITGAPVRADTVIPVVAKKSIETLILCLAVVHAGAAYLPIDISDPASRIEAIIHSSNARLYLAPSNIDMPDAAFVDASEIQRGAMDQTNLHLNHLKCSPYDLAYVIYTSGSTGEPKAVAISQLGLANLAAASAKHFWMKPSDCVYQFTNFTFDNSVLEITMALTNSSSLFVEENFFSSREFIIEIERSKLTHALLFPALIDTFTDDEIAGLARLRYWVVGAEALNERILNCALRVGVNVIQNYGPTETTAYALCKRMKMLDHPNNLGKPISNVAVIVRDSFNHNAFFMISGQLFLKGAGLMRGYIKVGRHTSEEFASKSNDEISRLQHHKYLDEYGFCTKDVVKRLPNNDLLFIGRSDQQVKIRGHRVELGEIEAVLQRFELIKSASVLLRKHDQQLAAYVTMINPEDAIDTTAIREYMLLQLPHYMVPTQFYQIDQLPLTKNSKVDKKALSAWDKPPKKIDKNKPVNVTEFRIWSMFKHLLNIDSVSTTDDFFVVGGNSLKASQLAGQIANGFKIEFSVTQIFRHRTVKRIANAVLSDESCGKQLDVKSESSMSDFGAKKSDIFTVPLSLQQQQMLFLNETSHRDYCRLIFVQKFNTDIDYRKLRFAFLRLIMRQPSLRTIFSEENYEVMQVIVSGTEAYFYSPTSNTAIHTNNSHSRFRSSRDLPKKGSEGVFRCAQSSWGDIIYEEIQTLKEEELNPMTKPPLLVSINHDDGCYTVVLLINHTASDAWSTSLLESEMSDLYEDISRGTFSDKKLSYTYAEYSVEQSQRLNDLELLGRECAEKIGSVEMHAPTFDHYAEIKNKLLSNQSYNQYLSQILGDCALKHVSPLSDHTEAQFTIDEQKLRRMTERYQATPFVLFLVALNWTLHALQNTMKLLVLVPTANRAIKTQRIIGNFFNTLLIPSTAKAKQIELLRKSVLGQQLDFSSQIAVEKSNINGKNGGESKKSNSRQSEIYSIFKYLNTYIKDLKKVVDDMRHYEEVPFSLIKQAISHRQSTLKNAVEQPFDPFKQIFFNFRYDLESGAANRLSNNSVSHPITVQCAHSVEVDVDCANGSYRCQIRVMRDYWDECMTDCIRACMISILCLMKIFCSDKSLGNFNEDPDIITKPVEINQSASPEPTLSSSSKEDHASNVFSLAHTNHAERMLNQSDIEIKLRAIWAGCLGRTNITDDDDFFSLGGNSLLSLKLKRMITKDLGIPIEVEEIFAYKQFKHMASRLRISTHRTLNGSNIIIALSNAEQESTLPSSNILGLHAVTETHFKLDAIVVFFHALIGGVTLPYASLVRKLSKRLRMHRIIGVQHPNSFSNRSDDPQLTESFESLCSVYANSLLAELSSKSVRIFIGASLGGILAYQCAQLLCNRGIIVDEIISIDGAVNLSHSNTPLSLQKHTQQMTAIIERKVGSEEISNKMKDSMISNAWDLLQLAQRYRPTRSDKLHVTLFRAKQAVHQQPQLSRGARKGYQIERRNELERHIRRLWQQLPMHSETQNNSGDYGWNDLCSTNVIDMPFSHDEMLDDCNTDSLAEMITKIIVQFDEK